MNTETRRIADQLRRALSGEAWHGDAISELLSGVSAEQAKAHPLERSHNIQEIVLHIEAWTRAALDPIQGISMPRLYETEKDWPAATGDWDEAIATLTTTGERLAQAIEAFPDDRLEDIVPGRDYNFYYLFHGIVQHSLYHAGQIAILKSNL
jgi:uncharacterized damage-inducible protein DinB